MDRGGLIYCGKLLWFQYSSQEGDRKLAGITWANYKEWIHSHSCFPCLTNYHYIIIWLFPHKVVLWSLAQDRSIDIILHTFYNMQPIKVVISIHVSPESYNTLYVLTNEEFGHLVCHDTHLKISINEITDTTTIQIWMLQVLKTSICVPLELRVIRKAR